MRLNSPGAKLRHGANFATGGQPLEGQTSPSLILEAVLSLLMCRLRFHQFKARSKRLYDAGYTRIFSIGKGAPQDSIFLNIILDLFYALS